MLAPFQSALDRPQADDGQRAGGATDDRVKFVQPIGQVGQAHHLAAEARRQFFAALKGAVGNRQRQRTLGREMGGAQFDHLAGADKQHFDLAQVFEQLPRQPYRGGGHADRVGADLGGGAHLLGYRKGALKQLAQRGAQGAGRLGGPYRVLDLPQDLRLAQYHGVQAAGDSEGVARGQTVFQRISV